MKVDLDKAREWQRRSAEKYAAKRRAKLETTVTGGRRTVRRTPVKPRSDKRAAQMREYVPLMLAFLEAHPLCDRCGKPSTCVHHTRGREGWRLTVVAWWKAACHGCNDFAETHTGEALAEGWLLPSKGRAA